MEAIHQLFDFFLHFDDHLKWAIESFGAWTYLLLAGIVFCETGLIVTPFLPGDSLLFAAGAFAGMDDPLLSLPLLLVTLTIAAIAGDAVNYAIGRRMGLAAVSMKRWRLIRPEHIERTNEFYRRHGGKAIILARFVPIVRTFAPFVAGAGQMEYRRFLFYNVIGAVAWVGSCTLAGYFFGRLPFVRDNFSLVAIGIVAVSLAPIAWEFARGWLAARRNATSPAKPAEPSSTA